MSQTRSVAKLTGSNEPTGVMVKFYSRANFFSPQKLSVFFSMNVTSNGEDSATLAIKLAVMVIW